MPAPASKVMARGEKAAVTGTESMAEGRGEEERSFAVRMFQQRLQD